MSEKVLGNKQTSTPTTTSMTTLPYDRRDWIDVEPGPFDKSCSEVSKKMIRLLRQRRRNSRIQNLGTDVSFRIYVFSALVNSSMAELLAKRRRTKEEISALCGSIPCSYHPILSSGSRPLWRKTHQSNIARQRVTTGRLRRAHLPRWKLQRYALDHLIWIDSGWQTRQDLETCGVLYGRESNVHRSLSRKGLRRDTAQNCSVQKQMKKTSKHSILV